MCTDNMVKNPIYSYLLENDQYLRILDQLKTCNNSLNVVGLFDSPKAFIVSAICTHLNKKGLFITSNELTAKNLFKDLSFFFKDHVVFFPAKEIVFYDVVAQSNHIKYERLIALDRLLQNDFKFAVLSIDSLLQKLMPKESFLQRIIDINVHSTIDEHIFTSSLVYAGYEKVSIVESKSQFAVRGGIIDIFPINYEYPIRIELFGDNIDSIRFFDPSTQRSTSTIESFRIIPSKDVTYNLQEKQQIIESIQMDLIKYLKDISNKGALDNIKVVQNNIEADIEKLQTNHYITSIDKFAAYFLGNGACITQYINNNDTIIFSDQNEKLQQRCERILTEYSEDWTKLLSTGHILPKSFDLLFNFQDIERLVSTNVWFNTFEKTSAINFELAFKATPSINGHIDILIEHIRKWKANSYKVAILAGNASRSQRFVEYLSQLDIPTSYVNLIDAEINAGHVIISEGSLTAGFEFPDIKFILISDKEIFGESKKISKHVKNKTNTMDLFTKLNIGDYVVHLFHGIGQYVGIQQLEVDKIKKDYIKLKYTGESYLYIPTDQLDLIQKYIGAEGKSPKLNKLGSSDWTKTKANVKKSVKELASHLIKLYAQRKAQKGFAFSTDTVWQTQFEEMFEYEETEDQLRCIEEIKKDMESPRPMDRLLCGDVGYGKTEVALRAIFKAVMDGKQVAYLVPTTILASQHYNNFIERLKEFPVRTDVLSRFSTTTQQKKILKSIKQGDIDVLIGTHKLLQKNIQFKDLGLLVIDEEQRFGVMQKEQIKNLASNVDVLTLTATPIPRTLHMSLVGIMDISTIENPPKERYPVQTYITRTDADIIKDSILKELSRGGQVFYLFNKVQSIDNKASWLKKLIPEARIVTAHGQMDKLYLEDVIAKFISGTFDVLVCTTIIESGVDMPNVNTIIVEDADKLGLSQLYQLRGRVGRSSRIAHAYLMYKEDKVLSEIAEKRLRAIREFTEFGSGFKIAMRDLEIRGAGNLIGREQHGFMESVGYDMYCRLLDETVKELKGEVQDDQYIEIAIDLRVNAYIDSCYIPSEEERIQIYKKIALVSTDEDILNIRDELLDRYGDIHKLTDNLIQISYLKNLGKLCGFSNIHQKHNSIVFQYHDDSKVDMTILSNLANHYKSNLLFNASKSKPYLELKIDNRSEKNILDSVKKLLKILNIH